MRSTLKMALVPAALALTLLASASAWAQTNISAGYQFAHVSVNGSGEIYPAGWYVDGSVGVLPMMALALQIGGIYKSVNGVTLHADEFLGGARLAVKAVPAVTPFVQALIGEVSAGASGSSNSAFSIQLGGGVDIKSISIFRLRLGADYRRNFFSAAHGGADNVFAGMLGVVLGGR